MKLRTKATFFFGTFLFVIALGVTFYAWYVVGNVFKNQAVNNLRIIAEQSESAYLAFLGSMRVRVLDWTSDNTVRDITKGLLATPEGSSERERISKEFTVYMNEKKMPFDKTIFLANLLDKDGVVIASTQPEKVGHNERTEEIKHRMAHDFDGAINSNFGEVFFGTIILDDEDGNMEPTLNLAARFFDVDKNGEIIPLDAVLLVYFSNVMQIADVLGSGTDIYTGLPAITKRQTDMALMESYQTSDIYLVNNDRLMVTPSRTIKDVRAKQKVDTLPVRECLENGREINEEYNNYHGARVLGASMCFQKEGVVILVEIEKNEIFAPITQLAQYTAIIGLASLFLGVFIIIFFVRQQLTLVNDIVITAKRIEGGDLDAHVEVKTNDELGYLATTFNTMIIAIRNAQKELLVSKYKTEEEAAKDEALLKSLGEGVIATDKSGNIIAINHMTETLLGLKAAEVVGRKAIDVIDARSENGDEIAIDQHISLPPSDGTATISKTMQYRRKDDGYFPVAITITPVILEDKILGSIEIFRDITKEREIEKTRGDLLALASHQLRTPLSGTKWLIETLKKGIHGPLTRGQTEYLDELYKINERMTGLVHDMLGVLRLEGGDTKTKKEDASTKDIIADVFETMRGVTESKNIPLHIQKDVDYTVNTDPILLRNILESFVGNAINYSESGREVAVWVEKKPSELVFVVRDSGIGIPKAEHRQIFERFYRASNAKTFDTRGSGLGLYIASMLAKKIGAQLSFESEEGKGSTFYVHLPYQSP